MSEIILSPGVYENENDQTFTAQGALNMGATFVGPTSKGPAFIPTIIQNGYNEFQVKFGGDTSSTYVPHALKAYLNNASTATVVRVLGNGGWLFNSSKPIAAIVTSGSNEILSVFHPSKHASPNSLGMQSSTLSPASGSISGSFELMFSGSGMTAQKYSASLRTNSQGYILNTIGVNENNSLSGSFYKATAFPYLNFKEYQKHVSKSVVSLAISDGDIIFTSSYAEGYNYSSTPWITNGNVTSPQKLFKFNSISHGFSTNTDVYVTITGLQEPADINGIEQYSTFNVLVRKVGDTDSNPSILESYVNLNLNPTSPNFIARAFGDKYFEYDATLDKVVSRGNYIAKSQYLRVEMSDAFNSELTVSSLAIKTSPRGFERMAQTINGFTGFNLPPVVYRTTKTLNNSYAYKLNLGFDFGVRDNMNYLKPVPVNASGNPTLSNQSDFTVNTLFGHPSASYVGSLSASVDLSGVTGPTSAQIAFNVAMQGGSDGMSYSTIKNMGSDISATNVFGFDLSTGNSAGSNAFNKALNILSNKTAYNMDLLVMPGILFESHPSVVQNAMDMVASRGDTFYIMDSVGLNSTVINATNAVAGIDSNYAATYYPWVKILDTELNLPKFVPPSVVVPGAFAFNDANAGTWFAPAGLNRGSLNTVIEVKNALSKPELDVLYSQRVNPILKFPGSGYVIWGQKTLQSKSSSLDRINVRRLMITLKKFISNASNGLVFDQNTTVTRNKFLSIVNPYLESIVQKQGLYAARVIMDSTNNTSDIIDRKQLIGSIYLQPTQTAEYIILNFNIEPTGATFE